MALCLVFSKGIWKENIFNINFQNTTSASSEGRMWNLQKVFAGIKNEGFPLG